MIIDTSRLARACVIGFILCFSLSATVYAKSPAQRWFDKASDLIQQNKLKEGIGYLKRAAKQGHGRAAFELASLHEAGLGVEKDLNAARKYYEVSVKQGYRDAHFNLALMLSNPLTPNNDLRKARAVAAVIAETGDVEAQYLLSRLMNKKMSKVSANPGKAFYWLQHAANSGHGRAQFHLGTEYLKGSHVSKSTQSALKWFKRAAMQHVPEAHYNLALMYEKGEGVRADEFKAIDWYKTAAKLGNADAQQNLGIRYLTGEYLQPQPKKAVELLTSAANSGSMNAQELLGKLYQSGFKDSIEVDLEKAEQWYVKAARQGKTEAQYQLALILLDKDDSEDEAIFWIGRAVAAGHVEATKLQANL